MFLKTLFEEFDKIDDKLSNNIAEISIKQSRIAITFEDQTVLDMGDIYALDGLEAQFSISNIATFDECLYVIFENLDTQLINTIQVKPFSMLYAFIFDLKEYLCSCPALEYVISSNYVKVYLDLPNINIPDLMKVDDKLGQQSVFQLTSQRPYLLYVKDW